ncbi:hypothetical protein PIB30_003227 [Stylosanthes scabra]|uniref:Uncharacterized protein n=1 Tax=Stylosanthes scabra TaxID=79078 RepID=A0ABU6Q366_9FABA|nr:hypothetical protein [Stylosanthes scabra]
MPRNKTTGKTYVFGSGIDGTNLSIKDKLAIKKQDELRSSHKSITGKLKALLEKNAPNGYFITQASLYRNKTEYDEKIIEWPYVLDLVSTMLIIEERRTGQIHWYLPATFSGKKIKKKGTKTERTLKRTDSKTESTGSESSDDETMDGERWGRLVLHVRSRAWEIVSMRRATNSEDYGRDECG